MKLIPLYTLLIFLACFTSSFSQDKWVVPTTVENEVSLFIFDEDFQYEGKKTYENSCVSCHGNPSQNNFTAMSPPPGDPASAQFQNQKDGALFYKIKTGRGTMPGFGEVLSDEEIWSIVAYWRSFNSEYEQAKPNLEGVVIPDLSMTFEFDINVDKLVVKLYDDGTPVADGSVSAFIKGMFGNMSIGKASTNELGIAYFDVDTKIPGDENGNITFTAKASKGYGSAKLTQVMDVATPTIKKSAIEGRHLWSTIWQAPVWLLITFFGGVFLIWAAIIYIIFGVVRIKKLK